MTLLLLVVRALDAAAAPSATKLRYPGGNGDVVLTIFNWHTYFVALTAVNLPTTITHVTGYTTSALTTTGHQDGGRAAWRKQPRTRKAWNEE